MAVYNCLWLMPSEFTVKMTHTLSCNIEAVFGSTWGQSCKWHVPGQPGYIHVRCVPVWQWTLIADWIKLCIHSLAISSEKLSLSCHNSVNAYLWDQWSVDHLRLGQTVMITTGNKKQQHWFKYIIIKVCLDLIWGSVD